MKYFFTFLAVGFYFTMTKLIPGFGDVKMPVQSRVRPFTFVNQDGKLISEKDVFGKVYVAEFFFTTCKSICPKMNKSILVTLISSLVESQIKICFTKP